MAMPPSTPPQSGQPTGSSPDGDPSMEDILASIRRILSEDEQPSATGANPPPPAAADDIYMLDASMLEQDPLPPQAMPAAQPEPPPPEIASAVPPPRMEVPETHPWPAPGGSPETERDPSSLVAPAAAAAAATSIGSLVRTLSARAPTHAGGPTIEDIVREEMRPLLKQWLDAHLPPLVERLVRVEIERVVSRLAP